MALGECLVRRSRACSISSMQSIMELPIVHSIVQNLISHQPQIFDKSHSTEQQYEAGLSPERSMSSPGHPMPGYGLEVHEACCRVRLAGIGDEVLAVKARVQHMQRVSCVSCTQLLPCGGDHCLMDQVPAHPPTHPPT